MRIIHRVRQVVYRFLPHIFMHEFRAVPSPLEDLVTPESNRLHRHTATVRRTLVKQLGGARVFREFKDFIARGNVIDLAVGIVIGAAFGKVVTSFVSDILMPPIGMLLGKVDFSNMYVSLDGRSYPSLFMAKASGAPTLNYGTFINTIIDFVIIAFAIFLVVKQVNKMRQPAEAPAVKECPFCLSSVPEKATRCPQCTSDLS